MSENYYAMTRLLARKQFEAAAEAERDQVGAAAEQSPLRRQKRTGMLGSLLRKPLVLTSLVHRRRLAQG